MRSTVRYMGFISVTGLCVSYLIMGPALYGFSSSLIFPGVLGLFSCLPLIVTLYLSRELPRSLQAPEGLRRNSEKWVGPSLVIVRIIHGAQVYSIIFCFVLVTFFDVDYKINWPVLAISGIGAAGCIASYFFAIRKVKISVQGK